MLRARMDARLYLIVSIAEADVVPAARRGGVDAVQLRDKHASDERFLACARELRLVCAGIPLILNDRAWLVRDAGADGVHVGEDDWPPERVRTELGDDVILGISTHDRAEVEGARGRGANYVGLGPMFATETKSLVRAPGGTALLESIRGATTLPLYPIGGLTAANVASLGATRIAVSSAICLSPDPEDAAAKLRALY